MDIAASIEPWAQLMREQIPGVELFDAHTHLGQNDPDGMSQTPEELLEVLSAAGARGAFVFPMHEPDGYPPANDMVLEAAAATDGLLTPFCRVSPPTGTPRPRRSEPWMPGPRGSSSSRGPNSSRWITPPWGNSPPSPTSAGCRC
jgi:hypothetical protein